MSVKATKSLTNIIKNLGKQNHLHNLPQIVKVVKPGAVQPKKQEAPKQQPKPPTSTPVYFM
jgi:hypothetical protein